MRWHCPRRLSGAVSNLLERGVARESRCESPASALLAYSKPLSNRYRNREFYEWFHYPSSLVSSHTGSRRKRGTRRRDLFLSGDRSFEGHCPSCLVGFPAICRGSYVW